jgi:alpha-tubulin suppressor-like RCC1 family protein
MAASFTVTGTNLTDGLKFALSDCMNIVELSGGNSTQRQFSCMPTGKAGTHQGGIYANAAATTPLQSFAVDYQAVAAFVANFGWRYAVIKSDGSLWSWDSNSKAVKVGDDYADVAVSTFATLAIKRDGSLWSWGISNAEGILGNGTTVPNTEPAQIGSGFVKVVVKGENTTGGDSAEALKTDGSLWVWGARSQQTPNTVEPALTPRMIGTGFVDIARGASGESFGIKGDGSLWTWNRNLSDTPFVPVKIADGYTTIATAYSVAYGLKADGSLWGWGRNLPIPTSTGTLTASTPAKVGDAFTSISTGSAYAFALKSDGSLWAGGDNGQNQFGDGTFNGGAFRQVNTGIAAAWTGSTCSFIKKLDGSLWAAGYCDLADGKYTRYVMTWEKVTL